MVEERLKFYEDRSAAETDDRCGMRYWWNRIEGGKGIVPKAEPLALLLGRETHLDLAQVAKMEDLSPEAVQGAINGILEGITDEDKQFQDKMELVYRRVGWLAAFALFVEPQIRLKYDNISIEREIILNRDPLLVGVTPDRLLVLKSDPTQIEYKEYKTTISASNKWIQSWHYQIQLHLGIAAASEWLHKPVRFAQIMGLMKGYKTEDKLSHPYVWGYYNSRTKEWTHDYQKARSAIWESIPVWEYPGGVVEWIMKCGPEVAMAQFPHSAPVFLSPRMLHDWVQRRTYRQRTVSAIKKVVAMNPGLKNIHFEKRTSQCRPAFGDACPYLAACWTADGFMDPMRNGEYIERVPHHDAEEKVFTEDLSYFD